jgi:glutathione synthase/RimK-type ligase-like ATP-grasp enzyme
MGLEPMLGGMRIALATCKQLPEPDVDEALLVDALRERGADAKLVAWDDPEADFAVDLCVVRSTWNYYHDVEAFLAWAARTALITTLWNPLPVIRWNVNKRYLGDLATRGVPTVPTVYLEGPVESALRALSTERAVIKPTVSAASFETMRVEAGNLAEADALASRIAQRCEVMVQPYVQSVEEYGERSIVWIDGAFTHAIRKSPRFGGEHESVSEALPIADDERALAEAALATIGDELLYARIDVARDEKGRPMIMELELIEPSLFLQQSEEALNRFANAVVGKHGKRSVGG